MNKTVNLTKPLNIDGKEVNQIELKLGEVTGEEILKIDLELKSEGKPGFESVYDQGTLLKIASKASGILTDELKKASMVDFLEITFSVRNFLLGLSDSKVEPENLEEDSSNSQQTQTVA